MFLEKVGQMKTFSLKVTTTPTQIASAKVIENALCGRHTVEVANAGSADVFIGDKSVTSTTGIPVKAGTSKIIPVNMSAADNLYIVGSGTVVIGEYFG